MRLVRCVPPLLALLPALCGAAAGLDAALGAALDAALTAPPQTTAAATLRRRDDVSDQMITCGYLNGNAAFPRSAQPGFNCRVDTEHGIWGFCPSTVIAASDCGLAAACKDSGTCTSVCRINSDTSLTTFTCSASGTNTPYCSTAMLTFGVDLSYAYLACGANPETQHYLASPTFTPTTSTLSTSTRTSAPTTATPSSTATARAAPKTSSSTSSLPSSSPSAAALSTSTAGTAGKESNSGGGSTTNIGAIVGGIVGGLALVCVSAVAVVFIIKRNSGPKKTAAFPPPPNAPPSAPSALSAMQQTALPPPPVYPQVYEADASTDKLQPGPIGGDGASWRGYRDTAVELPSNGRF